MLEFEHIIQINDPEQPAIPVITRQQLWDALVYRVRNPGRFNDVLVSRIVSEQEAGFVRIIQVGETEMQDEVSLIEQQEISTRLISSDQGLNAESLTRIEEPAPGTLIARFIYRRDSLGGPAGSDYDEMLKSAYLEMDRDAVRLIREWIANGWDPQQPWQ